MNLTSKEYAAIRARNGGPLKVPKTWGRVMRTPDDPLAGIVPSQRVTLPIPPSVNKLYATVRGYRVKTRVGREYAARVKTICGFMKMLSGPVYVMIDIYRPRKSGDLDNYAKICLDSLTGIAWADDSQIIDIHLRRFDDPGNPRAEVGIHA